MQFVAIEAVQTFIKRKTFDCLFVGQSKATEITLVAFYMVVQILGNDTHLVQTDVVVHRINAFVANRAFRSVSCEIVSDAIDLGFIDCKLFAFQICRANGTAKAFAMEILSHGFDNLNSVKDILKLFKIYIYLTSYNVHDWTMTCVANLGCL